MALPIAWKSWVRAKQLAVGLCLLLALGWLLSYRASEFHGDGTIYDAGFGSNPRYVVRLGQIPLDEAGIHRFRLYGLPSEEMSLRMAISGKSNKDRTELTELKTQMEVTLTDDHGLVLCKSAGIPTADELDRRNWILTASDDQASFYNFSCLSIQLSRFRTYTMEVKLTDVDSHSPKTYLVPELLDGGDEWL